MGKVLPFPQKLSPVLQSLVDFANSIDHDIHGAVHDGADLPDIAAVLANRLGEVLRLIKNKEKLWNICQEIAEKRAELQIK